MRGARRFECTPKQSLNLVARLDTTILFVELHTNTLWAITLCHRGNPDNMPDYLEFDRIIQQIQKHEYFVADLETLVGRNEQASAFDERHVGRIQRRFFLDGKRKNAGLGGACAWINAGDLSIQDGGYLKVIEISLIVNQLCAENNCVYCISMLSNCSS